MFNHVISYSSVGLSALLSDCAEDFRLPRRFQALRNKLRGSSPVSRRHRILRLADLVF